MVRVHGSWRQLVLSCALFFSPAALSWGDGLVRDGLGARSLGRGGTNIGHADNGQIILDNPAAMVDISSRGLGELSVDVLMTDLEYQDPQNNVRGIVKPYPMPQAAYIQKSSSEIFAYGLGIYAPAGFGAEYDMVHPVFGQHRQKSFGALVKVLPGVAVAVTDRLSVGAALGIGVSHIELEGAFHLQNGPVPGTPTLLDLQTTGTALAWNAGLRYAVTDELDFGLAYTEETRMKLDGNATAIIPGGVGISTFDADMGITWPRSLGAGLVYTPNCCHRFSTDVIWYNWSNAFDEISVMLNNPSNGIVLGLLGNNFREKLPLNWDDSVSVRLGYERSLTSTSTIRTGYVYHANPIPTATLTPYIPATLEHALTIGYGRRFGLTDVDLAYQYSWGEEQQVGTSSLAGGDFDNSRVDSSVHWLAISFIREF